MIFQCAPMSAEKTGSKRVADTVALSPPRMPCLWLADKFDRIELRIVKLYGRLTTFSFAKITPAPIGGC